jgi:hypothetical protein
MTFKSTYLRLKTDINGLTDGRTDGGYTIIRPFGRVKMTRMFIFNKLMMHTYMPQKHPLPEYSNAHGPIPDVQNDLLMFLWHIGMHH